MPGSGKSGFVLLDLTNRDWKVGELAGALDLELWTRQERIAVAALLRAAQQSGRRIRISIEDR